MRQNELAALAPRMSPAALQQAVLGAAADLLLRAGTSSSARERSFGVIEGWRAGLLEEEVAGGGVAVGFEDEDSGDEGSNTTAGTGAGSAATQARRPVWPAALLADLLHDGSAVASASGGEPSSHENALSVPLGPRRHRPWGILPLDASVSAARKVANTAKSAGEMPVFARPLCLRAGRRRLTRTALLSELGRLRSEGWRIDIAREPLTGCAMAVAHKAVPRGRVESRGGPGTEEELLAALANPATRFADVELSKDVPTMARTASIEGIRHMLRSAADARSKTRSEAGLPADDSDSLKDDQATKAKGKAAKGKNKD